MGGFIGGVSDPENCMEIFVEIGKILYFLMPSLLATL